MNDHYEPSVVATLKVLPGFIQQEKRDMQWVFVEAGDLLANGFPLVFLCPHTNSKNKTSIFGQETDAISVVMPSNLFPARPTSCGLPVINVDVCILDVEEGLGVGGGL